MPMFAPHVRLDFEQQTTPATVYYECRRCGRKTKRYRKMKKHLQRCVR
jgi:hypothetical protein